MAPSKNPCYRPSQSVSREYAYETPQFIGTPVCYCCRAGMGATTRKAFVERKIKWSSSFHLPCSSTTASQIAETQQ